MGWICVDDRLPPDSEIVKVVGNGFSTVGIYHASMKRWFNPFGERFRESVTHWKPLEEPESICRGSHWILDNVGLEIEK